ncbi:PREDICTED: uncharacterized protein LOC109185230 [Ipomoea nil]|uniref:uncharacterized protein LOC109185230 n=1 Tax=Ipomoea nil TaxID=35883 RepID=UPI0009020186|nr:PREDICTED: uncharacterized protein LOC109185230 [Ipomoea nil]
MANTLRDWNKNIFGNIHDRKRNLEKRLEGIQRKLDNIHNTGLLKLERKIRKELEGVLHQEEIFWFQQAREDWITSGDRNTGFYHPATMVKRAKNKKYRLKDDNGIPIQNDMAEEQIVKRFFEGLFTRDFEFNTPNPDGGNFPSISNQLWSTLNKDFTMEEVKNALFDMKPLKAPGPDGFHACLYQKTWEIVGNSIFTQAKNFYDNGILDEGMHDTLIALVPKNECPTNTSQFQPISL